MMGTLWRNPLSDLGLYPEPVVQTEKDRGSTTKWYYEGVRQVVGSGDGGEENNWTFIVY